MGYDFEIVYKLGRANVAADSLSRLHEEGMIVALSISVWEETDLLGKSLLEDPMLSHLMEELKNDPMSHLGFVLRGDLLFYKQRLVVSARSKWVATLIREFHDTFVGGHSGAFRTYRRVAENVYWSGMKKDIYRYVAKFEVCQRQKYQTTYSGVCFNRYPFPKVYGRT